MYYSRDSKYVCISVEGTCDPGGEGLNYLVAIPVDPESYLRTRTSTNAVRDVPFTDPLNSLFRPLARYHLGDFNTLQAGPCLSRVPPLVRIRAQLRFNRVCYSALE